MNDHEKSQGHVPPLSGSGESAAEPPRIEGYEIIRELGAGGMGIVYLAEQKKPIGRLVALKVIRPGMDSRQIISRFEAERQTLALLDHSHIAQIYHAGTTKQGRPYFAMELVHGTPITEYCDQHKLRIEERLYLFLQVCAAVQHAHQKGIIHRDLKPSNVIVRIEGDQSIPKVIDFGIAKVIREPSAERTLFTEQGQLIGTPEYMSPEQAEMTNKDIDVCSDIYSLGVLLYELLSGTRPFDRKSLERAGLAEILRTIREEDPPLPSVRLSSLGEDATPIAQKRRTETKNLVKCLKRELEWIPVKAMRKERNRRYQSAGELAEDITNYLEGKPLLAGPESLSYRVQKLVRRHRALVVGTSAVVLSLLAGIVSSTIFALGQSRARIEAVAARDEAQQQARISEAVNNFINRDLLASPDPSVARGRNVTVLEVLDVASRRVQGRFVDAPLIEAGIHVTLGITYLSLGEYEKAEPHSVRAFDLYWEQLDEEHRDTLAAMVNLALLYQNQGRYAEAEPLCLKALAISRRVWGEEDLDTLSSMNNLARLYQMQGRYADAEPLWLKTLEARQRILGQEHPLTLGSMGNLAAAYVAEKRYADAAPLYLKALEAQKRVLGEEHPDTLISMSNLAALYHAQKRYADAESLDLAALEIRTRVLGKEHPDTATSMSNLATHYEARERYADAESLYREAMETRKRVLGPEHPETIHALAGLFRALLSQMKVEAAETLGRQLLPLQAKVLGDADPMTLSNKGLFAELLEVRGKSAEAEELRREIRRAQAPEARQPPRDARSPYFLLDDVYGYPLPPGSKEKVFSAVEKLKAAERPTAKDMQEKDKKAVMEALKTFRDLPDAPPVLVARAALMLGRILEQEGRRKEALLFYEYGIRVHEEKVGFPHQDLSRAWMFAGNLVKSNNARTGYRLRAIQNQHQVLQRMEAGMKVSPEMLRAVREETAAVYVESAQNFFGFTELVVALHTNAIRLSLLTGNDDVVHTAAVRLFNQFLAWQDNHRHSELLLSVANFLERRDAAQPVIRRDRVSGMILGYGRTAQELAAMNPPRADLAKRYVLRLVALERISNVRRPPYVGQYREELVTEMNLADDVADLELPDESIWPVSATSISRTELMKYLDKAAAPVDLVAEFPGLRLAVDKFPPIIVDVAEASAELRGGFYGLQEIPNRPSPAVFEAEISRYLNEGSRAD